MQQGLSKIINESIKEQEIQCCVTQVRYHGDMIYEYAKGYGEVRQKEVNQDTIFQVASITKPIIATLILLLQEEGKLHISDSISKYLPTDTRNEVKIQHLLTHTSGFVDDYPQELLFEFIQQRYHIDPPNGCIDMDCDCYITYFKEVFYAMSKAGQIRSQDVWNCTQYPQKMLRHLQDVCMNLLPPIHQPGTYEEYCNYGYDLLSHIICEVTQCSLEQVVYEKLFHKIGMEHTFWQVPEDLQKKVVKRYKNALASKWFNSPMFLQRVNGHDSLKSTVNDMMLFMELIEQKGIVHGTRVMTEQSIELLLHTWNEDVANYSGRTLGFHINTQRDCQELIHLPIETIDHGGMGGSILLLDPINDICCVYFAVEEKKAKGDYFKRFIEEVYEELNLL